MSRLTEHQDTDVVCVYYGINKLTFRVECVSETKGGTLSLMRGGNFITHALAGKDGQDVCGDAFDLIEVRPVRASLLKDQGHLEAIWAELRDKAMEMKSRRVS